MNRALWLLTWFRFLGWWRRLSRNAGTVKGALFLIFGALLFGCWVFSLFLTPSRTSDPEMVRRFAPLGLLAYCLIVVLTSAGEKAISFSPAEINFLFPGPFSRRQLLAYKIVTSLLLAILTGLLFTLFFRGHASWVVAAFVGLMLALMFLQLFAMAIALIGSTLAAQAYNRGRKLLLLALGLLVVLLLLSLGRDALGRPFIEVLERLEQSPVVTTLLTPFRWFVETFMAERLWPDLVYATLLSLAVNGVLLAIVFLLDAHYLETVSAASERFYARLERIRSGPVGALSGGTPGSARFGLGNLPWWGGVGPILWRQLLTALRNLKGLAFILVIFGVFLVVPVLTGEESQKGNVPIARILAGSVFGMSIFLLQLLTFDFRGDVDRIEVLKTLPIRPVSLVIGQILTPALIATFLQSLSATIIELVWGGLGVFLGVGVLFVVPFNFLLFGIVNLLFLWFPTRMTPGTAGDFQMMGRQMMFFFGIYLCLGIVGLVVFLFGVLAYFLGGGSWVAALTTAWLMLAGAAAGLVPLLAVAFRHFDVARDTPP